MDLVLVGICLAVIIGLYFRNNPMGHSRWFMMRRFINWFPLGMSYSFLYMGRYNLAVAKNAFGTLMNNEDFGWIFAAFRAGFFTEFFAMSVRSSSGELYAYEGADAISDRSDRL